MKAAPRRERALQELPIVQQHRALERERTWSLSAPLLLEVRSAERPSLHPEFGGLSVHPDFESSLVEVLEASEKRLRIRFPGAAQPASWIPRNSVSGVIVNGRLRREDVEVRLEAALAVREPS